MMPAMSKRVNIRTTVAVRNVNPPISGTYRSVIMSTSDILKCLCRRAIVEEILPNGKTVRLNMRNYYLDNGAGLDAYHPELPDTVEEVVTEKETENEQPTEEVKVNATIVEMPVEDESEEAPTDPVVEEVPEESVVETAEETTSIDETKASEEVDESVTEENAESEEAEPEAESEAKSTKKKSKKKK